MTQRVRFGLNADPNIGGVAIAERITATGWSWWACRITRTTTGSWTRSRC
jgi:hypothetical protein